MVILGGQSLMSEAPLYHASREGRSSGAEQAELGTAPLNLGTAPHFIATFPQQLPPLPRTARRAPRRPHQEKCWAMK